MASKRKVPRVETTDQLPNPKNAYFGKNDNFMYFWKGMFFYSWHRSVAPRIVVKRCLKAGLIFKKTSDEIIGTEISGTGIFMLKG